MASIIRIKRSGTQLAPLNIDSFGNVLGTLLAPGELAYSYAESSEVLFIGLDSEDSNGFAKRIAKIGGEHYTKELDTEAGITESLKFLLIGDSRNTDYLKLNQLVVDSADFEKLNVDSAYIRILKSDSADIVILTNDEAIIRSASITDAVITNLIVDSAEIRYSHTITAEIDSAYIDNLELDSGHAQDLSVERLLVDSGEVGSLSVDSANIYFAHVVQLELDSGHAKNFSVNHLDVDSSHTDFAYVRTLEVDSGRIEALSIDSSQTSLAYITDLELDSGRARALSVNHLDVDSSHTDFAYIKALEVDSAHIQALSVDSSQTSLAYITDLELDSGRARALSVNDLNVDSAYIRYAVIDALEVDSAHIQALSVDSSQTHFARIDNLELDSGTAGELNVNDLNVDSADIVLAKIDTADIGLAQIDSAVITYADIDVADIDSATIQDAVITDAEITNADITNAEIFDAQITNARIDSAHISTLSVDSAYAGVLYTGNIHGPATIVIDPSNVGDNTGRLVILGDLQVDGVTTTVNSTTVSINDKNIVLADSAADSFQADGAGFTVNGANATITYKSIDDIWEFNKGIKAPSLEADSAALTYINSQYANITNLDVDSATITRFTGDALYADSGRFDLLVTNKLAVQGLAPNKIVFTDSFGAFSNDSGLSYTASTFTVTGDLTVTGTTTTGPLTSSGRVTATDLTATNLTQSGVMYATAGGVVDNTSNFIFGTRVSSSFGTKTGLQIGFVPTYDSGYYRFSVDQSTGQVETEALKVGTYINRPEGPQFSPNYDESGLFSFYGIDFSNEEMLSTMRYHEFKSDVIKTGLDSSAIIKVVDVNDETLFEVRRDGSLNFFGELYKDGAEFTGGGIFTRKDNDDAYFIPDETLYINDPQGFGLGGRIGIGTDEPKYGLHLRNRTIVSDGQFDPSALPFVLSGLPGVADDSDKSRFAFFPELGVTRGGWFKGADWNVSKIGNYSTAFGYNAIAQGEYSFVVGDSSFAEGDHSIAIGRENRLTGVNNVSIVSLGAFNKLDDNASSYSILIGRQNAVASFEGITIGARNTLSQDNAIALGYDNAGSGQNSISIGSNNITSGGGGITIGSQNTASGNPSYVLGQLSTASGNNSYVFGLNSTATGQSSMAIGTSINVDGDFSIGISLSSTTPKPTIVENNLLSILGGNVSIGSESDRFPDDGNLYVTGDIIYGGDILRSDPAGNTISSNIFIDNGETVTYTLDKPIYINKSNGWRGVEVRGTFQIDGTIVSKDGPADSSLFDSDILNGLATQTYGNLFTYLPEAGALRAGKINIQDNPNSKIGYYSIGLGYEPIVSGDRSAALGENLNVYSSASYFIGKNNVQDSSVSTSNVYVFGNDNTLNKSLQNSLVLGHDNVIDGNNNFAIGSYAKIDSGVSNTLVINTDDEADKVSTSNVIAIPSKSTQVIIGKSEPRTQTVYGDPIKLDITGNINIDSGGLFFDGAPAGVLLYDSNTNTFVSNLGLRIDSGPFTISNGDFSLTSGDLNISRFNTVYIGGISLDSYLTASITGNLQSLLLPTGSTATSGLVSITNASPARVTTPGAHGFIDGQIVTIDNVFGMPEINGLSLYVDEISATEVDLYEDVDLTIPFDTTTFGVHTSGSGSITGGTSAVQIEAGTPSGAISNISLVDPVSIRTSGGHALQDGFNVLLYNITGTLQLNNKTFYVDVINDSNFELYQDSTLTQSIDGTSYSAYTGGGDILIVAQTTATGTEGDDATQNILAAITDLVDSEYVQARVSLSSFWQTSAEALFYNPETPRPVGVRTNSPGLNYALDVNGNLNANSIYVSDQLLDNYIKQSVVNNAYIATIVDANYIAQRVDTTIETSVTDIIDSAYIRARVKDSDEWQRVGDTLFFGTYPNVVNVNVGIGTDTPTSKFQVTGVGTFDSGVVSGGPLVVEGYNFVVDSSFLYNFTDSDITDTNLFTLDSTAIKSALFNNLDSDFAVFLPFTYNQRFVELYRIDSLGDSQSLTFQTDFFFSGSNVISVYESSIDSNDKLLAIQNREILGNSLVFQDSDDSTGSILNYDPEYVKILIFDSANNLKYQFTPTDPDITATNGSTITLTSAETYLDVGDKVVIDDYLRVIGSSAKFVGEVNILNNANIAEAKITNLLIDSTGLVTVDAPTSFYADVFIDSTATLFLGPNGLSFDSNIQRIVDSNYIGERLQTPWNITAFGKQIYYDEGGAVIIGSPDDIIDSATRFFVDSGNAIFRQSTWDSDVNQITPNVVPDYGPGPRVMWIPQRGAFRAGFVDGVTATWEDDKVGLFSVGIGRNTEASNFSTAIGYNVNAGETGGRDGAVSVGYEINNPGTNTVAIGSFINHNVSRTGNVSIGNVITNTTTNNAVAIGYDVSVRDYVAIGRQAYALGTNSVSIGYNVDAGGTNSLGLGKNISSLSSSTVAIGSDISSVGTSSVAVGRNLRSISSSAVAVGINVTAGSSGVALGSAVSASTSGFATGRSSYAGLSAVSVGLSTQANGSSSVAIGINNQANSSSSVAVGVSNRAGFAQTFFGRSNSGGSYGQAFGSSNVNNSFSSVFGSSNSSNNRVSNLFGSSNTSNNQVASIFGRSNSGNTYGDIYGVSNSSNYNAQIYGFSNTSNRDVTIFGNNNTGSTLGNTTSSLIFGSYNTVVRTGYAYGRSITIDQGGYAYGLSHSIVRGGFAFGYDNGIQDGGYAFGDANSLDGILGDGYAFGTNNTVSRYGMAYGANNTVSNYAVALGHNLNADGLRSLAIGNDIVVNGEKSIGIGLSTAIIGPVIENNTLSIQGGQVAIGLTSADLSYILEVGGNVNIPIGGDYYRHGKVLRDYITEDVANRAYIRSNADSDYIKSAANFDYLRQTLIPQYFFHNDLSNLYYIGGGNVGIKTNSPQYDLHVNGDINFDGRLLLNGDVVIPSIDSIGDVYIEHYQINYYIDSATLVEDFIDSAYVNLRADEFEYEIVIDSAYVTSRFNFSLVPDSAYVLNQIQDALTDVVFQKDAFGRISYQTNTDVPFLGVRMGVGTAAPNFEGMSLKGRLEINDGDLFIDNGDIYVNGELLSPVAVFEEGPSFVTYKIPEKNIAIGKSFATYNVDIAGTLNVDSGLYINGVELGDVFDSAYVQARQTHYLDSSQIQDLIDSDYIKQYADSDWIKFVADSDYLKSIIDSDYIKFVADSDYLKSIIDSDYIKFVADSDYIKLVADSDYIKTAADSDWIKFVADSDYIKTAADSDWIKFVADSDYVKSIANVPYIQSAANRTWIRFNADSNYIKTAADSDWIKFVVESDHISLITGIGQRDVDFASNAITYSNNYANLLSLPNPGTYDGMFATVTSTLAPYVALNGNWTRLAQYEEIRASFSGGTGVTYDSSTGVFSIGQDVATDADVTFNQITTTNGLIVGGDLQVNGTTTVVNTETLQVADNMIYLNGNESSGSPTQFVDIGFAGNYNETGTYAHTGFFRDATDGVWKLFDGYLPEPDDAPQINTGDASFNYADLRVGNLTANGLSRTSTVVAGTYGSQSLIPVITVDSSGFIDSIGEITVAGVVGVSYNTSNGVFTVNTADGSSFSDSITLQPFTTSNLVEGTNLYYTDARVDSNIAASSLLVDGDGTTGGVLIQDGGIIVKTGTGSVSYLDLYCEVNNAHRTRVKSAPHASYSGNVDVVLPTANGTLALTSDITDTVDSAYINNRISTIDSGLVIALIDSAYVNARVSGLDSAAVSQFIDSAYVNARVSGLDSAAVSQFIDSDYINSRVSGLDSDAIAAFVDSAYISARIGAVANVSMLANQLQYQSYYFNASQGDTVFTGADANGSTLGYDAGTIQVYLNGVNLLNSVDYTATDGATVTTTFALDSGDDLVISSLKIIGEITFGLKTFVFTADSAQTDFFGADDNGDQLQYTPNNILVHVNGILIEENTDYVATNGFSIVLNDPAALNDEVSITAAVTENSLLDSSTIRPFDSSDVIGLVDSNYVQERSLIRKVTNLVTSSNITTIDEVAHNNDFASVEYTVHMDDSDNQQSAITKVLLTYNKSSVFMTEYGIVSSYANDSSMGDITADESGGYIRLRFTKTNGTGSVRVNPVRTIIS